MTPELQDTVIETPEGITIYPPSTPGKPWRAAWNDPDGQRRFKQAPTQGELAAKLEPITARLRADAHRTEAPLAELVAAYLDPSRLSRRRPWSSSYRDEQTRRCNHILTALGQLKCEQLRVDHLQRLVNGVDGFDPGTKLCRTVNAVMKIGLAKGFITNPRLHMIVWEANGRPLPIPKAQKAGETASFIDPRTLPGHRDIALLAGATQRKWNRKWWHELLIFTAAYTGMRNGELRALRAAWVDAGTRSIEIKEKAIELGGTRIELPKGGKERTTIFPQTTPSGYRLADELARRAAEAFAEQAAGKNPLALMFPNTKGGYQTKSAQLEGILEPAYRASGWRDEQGNGSWSLHTLRHVFCTTALNDWKLAVADVAVLAGHANTQITMERYVSTTAGTLGRAFAYTAEEGPDNAAARPFGTPLGGALVPGRPVEVECTIDADGRTEIAGTPVAVGPRWAGRQVIFRLDGTNMYGIAASALIGTWPCPVPALELTRLEGAMPAMATLPSPIGAEGYMRVERKVSKSGTLSIHGTRILVGYQHRGKRVTVVLNDSDYQILHEGRHIASVPRELHDLYPNVRIPQSRLAGARRAKP